MDLAVQDLNIDGDGSSEEYDFMDDAPGAKEGRQPNGQNEEPRRKYMDMLQKVADRDLDEVTIELNDLDNVSTHQSFRRTMLMYVVIVRKELWRGHAPTAGRVN